MFENLRTAFREAVQNFKDELNRDDVPEVVDHLLAGMRDEVTEAKASLRRLDKDLEETTAQVTRERSDVATCRRRERMAKGIGDEETARIAGEFAVRHERRLQVLEQKVRALEDEQRLRSAEIEEMMAQLKEAMERRSELTATAGRAEARRSLGDADDLFSELDRMGEKVAGEERARESEEALDSLDLDDEPGPHSGLRPDAPDLDARLAELKRRMGRD